MLYPFLKRFFDFLFSCIGFLLIFPIFLVVYFVLLFVNQGSAFFLQKRPGKNGSIFTVIKFKTMNDKKNKDGNLLPDSERLTPFGRFVRKTSLDEIPQLINVIKGDMSLVGPRPLLPEYLSLYNDFQMRRHEVRPGITGWAQVNGRNAISWEKKFELDVYYVDNISFWLDIKILLKTVLKVFKSEGVNQSGTATVEYFKGNDHV
jgi:lipopolysaccharide/colanic/teichoic acid biosynthesis glycosyltransferase